MGTASRARSPWFFSALACVALLILPAIAWVLTPKPAPFVMPPPTPGELADTTPEPPPPPRPAPRPVRPASTSTAPQEDGPVTGVVLDPDGRTVKGAFVGCDDRDALLNTVSDEEGRFTLAPEAAGCLAISRHPDWFASDRVTLAAGRSNSIRLNRGGAIEGVALDEHGAPLPSYLLAVESYQGPSTETAPTGQVRTITDPAGAFRWENLAPGRYVLTASADGRPPAKSSSVDVELGRTTHHVRIVIGKGGVMNGRVIDAITHRPVAGALLALDRITNTRAERVPPVKSDEQGLYSLEGVPAGSPFSVRVWREGYRTRILGGLTTRGSDKLDEDIELNPAGDGGDTGQDFAGIGAFLQAAPSGVSISGLFPGGPAEEAGVHIGDLIKRIDGADASLLSVADCMQSLRGQPGTRVTVEVERSGKRVEIGIQRRALKL